MRKALAGLAILFAFIMGFGPHEGRAQIRESESRFTITRGTTLWDLSRKVTGSGTNWHSIFDANYAAGILDSTDMSVTSGDTIVWLRPGDTILLRADAAERAPEAIAPIDTARAETPATIPATSESRGVPWWLMLLLLVAFAAIATLYRSLRIDNRYLANDLKTARNRVEVETRGADQARLLFESTERELRATRSRLEEAERLRQPAETFTDLEIRGLATGYRRQRGDEEGEGPSFIEGGITSSETLGLALQRAAQIVAVRRDPDAPVVPHTRYVFQQGIRGRVIAGTYSSLFADGTERVRVIERGNPETHRIVWKATAVAPDGAEFDTYAEEICANGMAIPISTKDDFVWEELPDTEQIHTLPQSALYVEPPAIPTPEPEAVAVEMIPVVEVTTPDGRTFHLPAGTIMSPIQIPASEMTSPVQGSESGTSS